MLRKRIVLAAVALAAFCAAAGLLYWYRPAVKRPAEVETDAVAEMREDLVTLADQKLASVGIRVAPALRHPLQEMHVVPGRIMYDETRRVDIRVAADGILRQVCVAPGDRVSTGQVLAIFSSPEIGEARTEVHHAREGCEMAAKKLDWERETSRNVAALIAELKSHAGANEVEKKFKGKTFGKSREVLMTAYSRYLLAQSLFKSSNTLGAGILPLASIEERVAERRSSEAALLAVCEQAGFDVTQQRQLAEIEDGGALRRLRIAQQQLTNLLHYAPDPVPEDTTQGDLLSRVEIRALFAGTIEQKHFAQADRLRASDTIFVLADTKTLWIAADIREQDWRALSVVPGEELSVEAPALPRQKLKSRVKFVGRRVNPATNSVPLVAEISNADALLRPGLFAHISIPIGAPRSVLCVPPAAIVQQGGAKSLFVQVGPKTFRRTAISTGMETDRWLEIVRGIKEGTPIVVAGSSAVQAAGLKRAADRVGGG